MTTAPASPRAPTTQRLLRGGVLVLLAATGLAAPAPAQENCNPVVTSNRAGGETTPALAFDGDVATFFRPVLGFPAPGFNTLVTIDFGCVRTLERFRRYLSRDGSDVAGNRIGLYEQVRYSLDGVNYTYLTVANSSGWDGFAQPSPLWGNLPYGWSPWLVLDTPVEARYLGFIWGSPAIGQPLHEIEVDLLTPPPPPGPPGTADLSVSLCGTTLAEVFDPQSFTVTVTNRGPETATGVVLRGGQVWETPSQGACEVFGNCNLGALAAGASATANFVNISFGGGITRVSVSGDLPDANAANNSAQETTTVMDCEDLVQNCPLLAWLGEAICLGQLPASSCPPGSPTQQRTLWSRATAALRGVVTTTALKLLSQAVDIDLGIFHRLRGEVLPTTPIGRRYLELYETHGPEISGLIVANPALRERGAAALELWEESLRALVEGRGGEASVTAQQIAELEGVLEDIKDLGSAELRSVIEREQALLDLPTYVGRTMEDALERFQQPGCPNPETSLCLKNGRFRATVSWRDFQGRTGVGRAVPLTHDTGSFWFFRPGNVELMVKVLDGRGLNGRFWVFFGALSSVEYTLRVEDTVSGAVKTYTNPSGNLASIADTAAFAGTGELPPGLPAPPPAASRCAAEGTSLCLNGGRFEVQVAWRDFQGRSGVGRAVDLTADTGYFWFFGPQNVEVVIKILDGRLLNRRFWVFYGALSSVEYTITVRDRNTGVVKTYTNLSGRLASVADTSAF